VVHFLILAVCAAAIYFSCEWFVNAVEWLGQRLNIGNMAVGTILAAIGTALPESVVTFVAVVFGHDASEKELGVGAAMGGPLVLATLAYGVVGIALLRKVRAARQAGLTPDRPARNEATIESPPVIDFGDTDRLARDQRWFLAIFVVKVALGLVVFAWKPWLGLAFLAAYGVYFWREIREDSDDEAGDWQPLLLQRRRAVPSTWAVVTQTLATLAVIFLASQLFVGQLNEVGPILGLPPAVTALLLSPIATELPEIMNAVIWVRAGKIPLALANISGSMMIQATIPSALGIIFTPWLFDSSLLLSGVVTMAAITYLLVLHKRDKLTPKTLAASAGFYLIFAVGLAVTLH
jgi:cation:H+ antiporter